MCGCTRAHTHTHTQTHTHTHSLSLSYHVRNADQWGKKWILPTVKLRTVPMPVCSQTHTDQAWLPSLAPNPCPPSMFALLFQWECFTVFTLAVCMLIDVVFHYPWSTAVPSFFCTTFVSNFGDCIAFSSPSSATGYCLEDGVVSLSASGDTNTSAS